MAELLHNYIIFGGYLKKNVRTVHTNFHAKSGVCRSKNGCDTALGMILYSLDLSSFFSQLEKEEKMLHIIF